MAVAEFKTPGGIIVPRSAIDFTDTKADRSQSTMIRAISGWGSQAGRPNRQAADFLNAIRIPWVFRCVMTIAASFAASEWDLMEGDEEAEEEGTATAIEDPNDEFLQLIERPNPVQSGFHFRELALVYMELLGENFISLENKDARGRPRELYILNPAYVTVHPDPVNYVRGYSYNPFGPGFRGIPYEPDEIIHMKLPNPKNPYRGFGAVEASAVLLDIVEAMGMHELTYYRSGGRIVGVLETENEVDDDDFEKIKRDWQEFSADKSQRLKTAILEAGLKYTPIAEGMRQIDATSINKEKRDAILATFGVPLTKVGILENAQYKASDADRTFESETMQPKKIRWEHDIQPLVDLFNPARYIQYDRKDFDDDSTKFGNARTMSQIYVFTVNDILTYLGYPDLGDAGEIIWAPSQLIPQPVKQLGELAGAMADETINPPEPPAPIVAPVVGGPTGPGSNNGSPGNGSRPPSTTNQPSPKVEELRKALGDLLEEGGKENEKEADVIAADIVRVETAQKMLAHRFTRRRGADQRTGQKQVRRVSSRSPATSTAKMMYLARFLNRAIDTALPEIKRAFKAQRRKVLQAVPEFAKAKDRRELLTVIGHALPKEPMEDAVRGLHVSALVQGFHDGSKVLPPRNANLLQQKLAVRKAKPDWDKKALPDYIAPDAPDWRAVAEEWRGGQFPFLESSFDKLAANVTQIDETTRGKLADTVEEGLRRGYSPLQIANGYDQEGYRGVAGVMDNAEDWRAEMIARTEGRQAFEAGSLASYAMAEVPAVEAVDGDEFDEACRTRNGSVFPLVP
jgi:HK97 family phage portal protein